MEENFCSSGKLLCFSGKKNKNINYFCSRSSIVFLGVFFNTFLIFLFSSIFSNLSFAAPALTISAPTFTPANPSRTYMDVGGVWNGTTEVTATTGDAFSFSISNGGGAATTAFELAPTVNLPTGFSFVAGTATVSRTGAGCTGSAPTVSATQVGGVLTFTLSPAGFDLDPSCSLILGFGLTTTTSALGGTYNIAPSVDFSNTNGGALTGSPSGSSTPVLVKAGASLLTVNPVSQDQPVGATATFTPSVCNSGTGGLFNVTIDDSSIAPANAAGSLTFGGITQATPATPIATVSGTGGSVLTIPYLAPGQCFSATVTGTVTGCAAIDNTIATSDRTGVTSDSITASVKLDPTTPLISYPPPSIVVPPSGTTSVSVPVSNTNNGDALQVKIPTGLGAYTNVVVSNVAADWSYNSSSGLFTYTAGTIPNGVTKTLTFDVSKALVCPPPPATTGVVVWKSDYRDGCDNRYSVPSDIGSLTIAATPNPVTLSKSGPPIRLEIGNSSTWNLTVTPSDLASLNTDPIVLTDVIPNGIQSTTLGAAPAGTTRTCSGSCISGSTITWTIPKSALTGPLTLPVGFQLTSDACFAGTTVTNNFNYSGTYTAANCSLNQSAGNTFYTSTSDGFPTAQSFFVNGGENVYIETGLPDDGDYTQERNLGEGQTMTFTNTINFGATTAGTWAGSTYTDNFGGLTHVTIPTFSDAVQYCLGSGCSSFTDVPSGQITRTSSLLTVDLGFLSGNVAGQSLTMKYRATTLDADLISGQSRTVVGLGKFNIANGAGACGSSGLTTYTQSLPYFIYRNVESLTMSVPSKIDVCGPFTATFTAQDTTYAGGIASNSLIKALTSGASSYTYLTPQTPTYGGAFNTGNMTYAENGGVDPTFEIGPVPVSHTAGSVAVQMRLKALSSTTPSALMGTLDYDDTETAATLPRNFTSNGSAVPLLVRQGDLQISISPSTVTVPGSSVQFSIFVLNGGDGNTFNTTVRDILPASITPDTAGTNALNPSYPVTVSGQQMDWNIGTLTPGQFVEIKVKGTVAPLTCSIPANSNSVTAKWGCGGVDHQSVTSTLPNFSFPSASMQVLHDTTLTQAGVCDPGVIGRDVLIVRNTGSAHIYNVQLSEILNPTTTGVDKFGGLALIEYRTLNGAGTYSAWTPAIALPSGNGDAATPYVFTSASIPPLADLATTSETSASVFVEVQVRFPLQASELANTGSPSITLSGTGTRACGSSVPSPGTPFSIPIFKPNIVVNKRGLNLTTNPSGTPAETVYGKPGDDIEWYVWIENLRSGATLGQQETSVLYLKDDFPNSFAAGQPPVPMSGNGLPGGSTIGDNVDLQMPNTTFTSALSYPTVNAQTYRLRQTLGNTCLNTTNTASTRWGCSAATATLTTPQKNSDTAALEMNGNFGGAGAITQSFTTLPGGRGEITLVIKNVGAFANNIVVTNTLPSTATSNFIVDTSFTPTLTPGAGTGIIGMTVGGTANVPTFTMTPAAQGLDNNQQVTIKFRVVQNGNFDTTDNPFTNPETVANGLDPSVPATWTNSVRVDVLNGCGSPQNATATASMDPLTPDVDISVAPLNQVVIDGTAYTFNFTLTNNGDAGSVANNITFTPTIGSGWSSVTTTVLTPGTGGSGGACGATCTSAQIGTLASGASAVIRVTATANANGNPLTIKGLVQGQESLNDGSLVSGSYYSQDTAQVRISGFVLTKTLVSTSESFTTDPDVAIGEEITWRLKAVFFGSDPSDATSAFSNIVVKDTLPAGYGYVSYSTNAGHTATISSSTLPAPVATGTLTFNLASITGAAGATFDINLVARALNIAGNTNGLSLKNNLGVKFDQFGTTFRSSDVNDGFAGGTADAALHADHTSVVRRPTVAVTKQIRNVTTAGSFAATATGDAGDTLEYRLTFANTGNAPAFDISVPDILSSKFILINGATDGIDNDGDGLIDAADVGGEGSYSGTTGGTVTFNDVSTGMVSGTSFGRLNAGSTLTMLFRATVDTTAIPNETISNTANSTYTTLPGLTGSQTAPTGATGSATGEYSQTLSASANLTINQISLTKTLDTTSVGNDTLTALLIGEQERFKITIVLPEGTTPSLVIRDSIPASLSLVQNNSVTLGSSISGCNSPTYSNPNASLPASGSPLVTSWTFGSCTVASGTAAQRTITILYITQVQNIAAVTSATTGSNSAQYSFNGGAYSAASTTSYTVQEPVISAFTKTASPVSALDAGDQVTYTVSFTNSGTSPMYNVNIVDTIPSTLQFVAGSTTVTTGPALTAPDVVATGGGGQTITWGRAQTVPQNITLNVGATLTFTYKVALKDNIEPTQTLTNSVKVDFTSLPEPLPNLGPSVGLAGATLGERDGSGTAPNSYTATRTASVTTKNTNSVVKTKAGDTLSPTGFKVGDLISYTLTATVQEGTLKNFKIKDTLPTGLKYYDLVSITPSTGSGGMTYTTPTNPLAGATGTLTWSFGDLISTGDNSAANQTIALVFRARVMDTSGIAVSPTTQTLTNSSQLEYSLASGVTTTSVASTVAVDVKQPLLTTTKSLRSPQTSTVTASDSVLYRVTVANIGTGPAYGVVVVDTLPVGMRVATPTTQATTTLNGSVYSLSIDSYNSTTGVVTWKLPNGVMINAGQSLVIDYNTTADATLGAGLTLTNSAQTTDYRSQDACVTSSVPDCRQYAATSASTTNVTSPAPSDMTKTANVSVANIGDTITYTLTAPSTDVDANLYDVRFRDTLPTGLKITSVTTNATALSTTITNASTTSALDVTFARVAENLNAVVTVAAVVENILSNQDGVVRTNSASYTWAKTAGGAAQAAITAPGVSVTLKEPTLTIDKTLKATTIADTGVGLQAGDKAKYTITIQNTGTGPAYDLVIDDIINKNLGSPSVTANPDNPGAPTGPVSVSSTNDRYRWNVAGPIAAGATYKFDVEFTLGSGVQPYMNLVNTAQVTWTSTSGANSDERNGSGGVNDYSATDPTPVTLTTGGVTFTKTESSPSLTKYNVGDEVNYRLKFDFLGGQVLDLRFEDTLPTGMEYRSVTVSSVNAQKLGGGAIALVTGPAAGATSPPVLDFRLGNIESTAGTTHSVILDIVTRIKDVVTNTSGVTLQNTGKGRFDNPSSPGTLLDANATSSPVITVTEPALVVALDAPSLIDLASSATLDLRSQNNGTGSAYQPTFNVLLPTGMRAKDPTTLTHSLTLSGGRTLTLVEGTDYTLTYSSTTGELVVHLIGANGYLAPGESIDLSFKVAVDSATVDGTNFTVDAYNSNSNSTDQSITTPSTQSRQYTHAAGTGTQGTANGAAADDYRDHALLTARAPILTFTKAINKTTAIPGDTLTYTVVFKNDGPIDASMTSWIDNLAAEIQPGTLTAITVTPAGTGTTSGTLTSNPSGGTHSTGTLSIANAVVGASGGTLTVVYQAQLKNVIKSGTYVSNQAAAEVDGYSKPFLTDSTQSGDNDGVESGNSSTDPNDDDPTRTLVSSAPVIKLLKTSTDDNGSPLAPNDVITYTITAENTGNEDAVSFSVVDVTPPHTTYVPNSTQLNGVAVSDIAGTSPLVAGMSANSSTDLAGVITAQTGRLATISFKAKVDSTVVAGTLIQNQAISNFQGDGSGPQPPVLSDDPSTSSGPDATTDVVGSGPSLYAQKTVTDVNGGASLLAGEELEYTIILQNNGSAAATNVVLRDAIPTGTTYVVGSLQVDADGSGPGAMTSMTDALDSDGVDYQLTNANEVTWTIPTIAANSEKILKFKVLVSASATTGTLIRNQGHITADALPPISTDQNGNSLDGNQPTDIVVGNVPLLIGTKTAIDVNGGVLAAGDQVLYTVQIKNNGSVAATSVNFTDPVPPPPTTYVAGSTTVNGVVLTDTAGPASALAGGVSLGTINPGSTVTIQYRVQIPAVVNNGTTITNQGHFYGSNTPQCSAATSCLTDSDLDDNVETGNDALNPNDDDPTKLQIGGSPGLAQVRGLVYLDSNHNRTFDSGDSLKQGWIVEVLQGTTVVSTSTTDSNGQYEFLGLPPGSGYQIRFRHPTTATTYGGAQSSEPGVDLTTGTIKNLTLPAGFTVLDQNLPLDPNGVVYNSVTRVTVPGAIVTLKGPTGFNPTTQLLPGQAIQTTASDGFYRFDLISGPGGAPDGVYTLQITVPNGFLPTPSGIIPAQTNALIPLVDPTVVQPQSGAPQNGDSTTYYYSFDLKPMTGPLNAVVNNHVPIDPILKGAILLTKSTPLKNAARGSMVPYTIKAKNQVVANLMNIDISDVVPPGFAYYPGSATIDHIPIEPTINGRTLTWTNLSIPQGTTATIQYTLIVTTGVSEGVYTNDVVAINNVALREVSNHASASVQIAADPIFDCPEVIGKVFDDTNRDGYQDQEEPGLAGVRVVTARGWLTTTDSEGRYHVTCPLIPNDERGSNFILKVDEHTLPTGYRITSENPLVIHLTRGKMSKANFGAAIHRVLRLEVQDAAFVTSETHELKLEWDNKLRALLQELRKEPTHLRLAYWASQESEDLVRKRIAYIKLRIQKIWKDLDHEEKRKVDFIETEEEISWSPSNKKIKAPGGLPALDVSKAGLQKAVQP